jgi:hypothetical protein
MIDIATHFFTQPTTQQTTKQWFNKISPQLPTTRQTIAVIVVVSKRRIVGHVDRDNRQRTLQPFHFVRRQIVDVTSVHQVMHLEKEKK